MDHTDYAYEAVALIKGSAILVRPTGFLITTGPASPELIKGKITELVADQAEVDPGDVAVLSYVSVEVSGLTYSGGEA